MTSTASKEQIQRPPFKSVVAMTREDAKEWADPHPCYAVDYIGQADIKRHRFGAKVYRIWIIKPTAELRKYWEAT